MAPLNLKTRGSGDPLLLVHGTGTSHKTWGPVADRLAGHRKLLLVDLPGHGDSPPMPDGLPPTPRGYAQVLAGLLDDQGLDQVDVAGFSVGGWTALELARLGRASSVVALAPAGLWKRTNPWSAQASLRMAHHMSRAFRRVIPLAFSTVGGRTIFLGQNFGRPWRVPRDAAIRTAQDMANMRGFDEHLRETSRDRFHGGAEIDAPITVAFGSREALIPKRARLGDELPADTRWIALPGCGHIPFWDAPELVGEIILEGTERLQAPRLDAAETSDGEFITSPATGERFRMLSVPRHVRRAVSRLDWFLEPDRESPLHVHPHQEERVIGVSGELTLRVGDRETVCRAGEVVPIPAGVPHSFANRARSEAHMLVEFRPALETGEFFTAIAGLSDRAADGKPKRPNPIRAAVTLQRYRREFRLARPPAAIQRPVLSALAGMGRAVGYRAEPAPAQRALPRG